MSLQKRVELAGADGSYKLSTEERPVSLELVEPDPTWFGEGSSYAELKPSEMSEKISARLGAANQAHVRNVALTRIGSTRNRGRFLPKPE